LQRRLEEPGQKRDRSGFNVAKGAATFLQKGPFGVAAGGLMHLTMFIVAMFGLMIG